MNLSYIGAVANMQTKTFDTDGVQAVRIPAELAYEHQGMELEIERIGDEIRIRPAVRQTLAGVMDIFARFSPDFLREGRGEHGQTTREGM